MFRFVIMLFTCALLLLSCSQQQKIRKTTADIYNNALQSGKSYEMLEYLCAEAPGRLPGTVQSEKAIACVKENLIKNGADSVWLFPVNAPGWKEIKKPVAEIILNSRIALNSISLGQCISTSGKGIEAPVIMVSTKEQVDSIGENGLKGKIVFFNVKMKGPYDYGKFVWARVYGASMVSRYGALGVMVRSLTTKYDDNPHAGVVIYKDDAPKIPAIALSWMAADTLETYLKKNPDLMIHLETFCENPGFVPTHNVVGEIKGNLYPDEILFLTAHLDGWHNTQGAHDDGSGVSQIVDVLRIFKELKIKPKRTIRVMPYVDEEQFNTGMTQYMAKTAGNKQKHLFRIEVDNGTGIPNGFNIQADSHTFSKQDQWRKYLEPYNLTDFAFAAESNGKQLLNKPILAYLSSRDSLYFDYHHSSNDIFEVVDKKNLQSGSAALAAFIYLLDKLDVIDVSILK